MAPATPLHYDLTIEPDLETFTFNGRVLIRAQAAQPVEALRLNTRDLALESCRFSPGGEQGGQPCEFSSDPAAEETVIRLPRAWQGAFSLEIAYSGTINDQMAGFYRSGYEDNGQTRYIAVTQFQESDARRALPCWDHPLHKATFDVTLIIEAGLTAISNEEIQEETLRSDGRRKVRFKTTPKMSTYLLFFGVGDFKIRASPKDPRVRTVVLPGREAYAAYGGEFGRQALGFCEEYYGIPYPLGKMDLIAVPDFAFGAMENWGAITFRENLLLHYPQTTSPLGEVRICEVIAHEIAHQWFGNLVTPEDWKYLWLNESFATYFGYGVVDHFHPDWRIWDQFLDATTEIAMERDAMLENFPIEIPGTTHMAINSSTAPIIYSKGGSILRQVEGFLGPAGFRAGLGRYLRRHAHGNTASHHLWDELGAAAEKPITPLMRSWVEQPGFPLVTVETRENELVLRQQRFSYLPQDHDQTWQIPLKVRLSYASGASEDRELLMTADEQRIPLKESTLNHYLINPDRTGFYRVRYAEPGNLKALGKLAAKGELAPRDRWGLQSDLFALVKVGKVPLGEYLQFVETYFINENAFLPLMGLADNLQRAFLLSPESGRESLRRLAAQVVEQGLAQCGLESAAPLAPPMAILKDRLLSQALIYGSDEATDFAQAQFQKLRSGATVDAAILKSVLLAGALHGDGETLDFLTHRFETAPSEHERTLVLLALGGFSAWELTAQALAYVLENVPDRNRFMPIAAAAGNLAALPHLWDWYRAHIAELETMHPLLYERVIAAIVPSAGLGREAEVKAFFQGYLAQEHPAADAIGLSLEKLEINRRFRAAVSTKK
ncbi:MAG: M1 family metallopeptidase [Desulfobacterales bacterium]